MFQKMYLKVCPDNTGFFIGKTKQFQLAIIIYKMFQNKNKTFFQWNYILLRTLIISSNISQILDNKCDNFHLYDIYFMKNRNGKSKIKCLFT